MKRAPFRLIRVRSPLLAESRCFPFLRVLRCFSSPTGLHPAYTFSGGCPGITPGGLPHSDIHGSKPAGGSPWLFAANHVLLRPSVPRHPPRALASSAHRSLGTLPPAGLRSILFFHITRVSFHAPGRPSHDVRPSSRPDRAMVSTALLFSNYSALVKVLRRSTRLRHQPCGRRLTRVWPDDKKRPNALAGPQRRGHKGRACESRRCSAVLRLGDVYRIRLAWCQPDGPSTGGEWRGRGSGGRGRIPGPRLRGETWLDLEAGAHWDCRTAQGARCSLERR